MRLAALLLCAAAGGIVGALAIAVPPLQARANFEAAIPAAPEKPLRFVSYNVMENERGIDRVVAQIRLLRPDFVLLQEVYKRDVDAMARELNSGSLTFSSTIYSPSHNILGRSAEWGNAILSRYPLYECEQIPHPDSGSFGVWAWTMVDNHKFMLASVHLTTTWKLWSWNHWIDSTSTRYKELTGMLASWEEQDRPPLIVGGDFAQLPIGTNYAVMTRELVDALDSLGHGQEMTLVDGFKRARMDYLLTSRHWKFTDGGVGVTNASDHRPIWLSAHGVPAPTTQSLVSR
jgi:endonuclease/exonuclease/phosphatase family metal-dependent hydrolase